MLVSLTVGKVDAGVAVLLTEDKRLIEFPSILLPKTIQSGSIVDITVRQNHAAEQQADSSFLSLQEQILQRYGLHAPSPPVLRLKNATQTSIVLEWDAMQLATSTLRSLSLYKNGVKAGTIPRPMEMTQTKLSGLQINAEFSFYLVLRTSGGTYTSNTVTAKTHEMTNLTGICVTPGVLPPPLRSALDAAVQRIGAKMTETIQLHTTHFVCTEPRGDQWQKAVDTNIPVVRPEWLEGCEREGKIVGVRGYYLDADPKLRMVGTNPNIQSQSRDSIGATGPQSPPPPRTSSIPAGSAAAAAAATTTTPQNLPDRSRVDRGEGEPGPEITRTPPIAQMEQQKTQKNLPPNPPSKEEDDEDDDESEDDERRLPEDPEKQGHGLDRDGDEEDDEEEEHEHPSRQQQAAASSSSSSAAARKPGRGAAVEDDQGEDMEDVAL